MKKFVFVHVGFVPPTSEIMEAWGAWFASFEDKLVDGGNLGVGPGKEITDSGMNDLPFDAEAITGFSIIEAENMDAAVRIAEKCPSITSIRVYETRSM